MSKKGLYNKLIEYRNNGRYPFHMPGHKRQVHLFDNNISRQFIDPYDIDITEINGFDNLHHPEDIIKESMDNASRFFGTGKTWFLINGSSCGILAAINAVTNIGDSIIVGRNCHKAVYNAIEIRNLQAKYIYPEYIDKYGINGGYVPEDIEKLLRESKEKIKAVVITSPTYEGIISDVEKIAKIVHRYGGVLIVDEAHGAHLGICKRLPSPAYRLGADIVIESTHKTLPAMTQTALMHLCGDKVDENKLYKALSIYESSSPSYVLMASIDKCIRELQINGNEKLEKLLETIKEFHNRVDKLQNIEVPGREIIGKNAIFDFDVTKLIISIHSRDFNGKQLEEVLREKYNMEMEMTSQRYVLAMTSMCDDMKQILKLADALEEIDRDFMQPCSKDNNPLKKDSTTRLLMAMSIYEAERNEKEIIELESAEGRICGEYVYVYPPEIPIIVPGEIFSREIIEKIYNYKQSGLNLKGLEDVRNKNVKVLKRANVN